MLPAINSIRSAIMECLETGTVKYLLIFLCTLLLAAFIYGQVKKPRKRIPPGPMGLPIVGYLPFLGPEPPKTLAKLSEKYGSIFSIYLGSRLTVILNDYETMKETICHTSALDRGIYLFDHVTDGKGFGCANGPAWEEQRRFAIHAMRNLGLGRGAWQVLLQEEINSFLEDIGKTKGQPIDISDIMVTSLANNIISLLIGRRLQKDTEKDKIQLLHQYSVAGLTFSEPTQLSTLFPKLRGIFRFFKIGGYHRLSEVVKEMKTFLRDEIDEHKRSTTRKEELDFIDLYLEHMKKLESTAAKSKHYFNEDQLEGNIEFLFLGGSDTLYNSLLWCFPLMAAYPDVQTKIQAELDGVFGRDGKINFESRNLVPYTFATLLEMERFASIVPLNSTRRAREDFIIRGYTIPKDSEIIGNLWFIHNDPKYWNSPEQFLPDRFLSHDGTKILKLPSYLPFSTGRRNCPGETVAWMSLFLYFSSTLRRFAITAPPKKEVKFDAMSGLVTQMKSQDLCFHERV